MSKRLISLNGSDFINMVAIGSKFLQAHVEKVNELNVFPVPDGDTGTNMNLTFTAGVEEFQKKPSSHIGHSAETLSKGLLMGARGNSGVILSQLFRGFAKSVHDLEEINSVQFAAALQQGVDTAYKAVVKPVEGTILTVSREAAKHAVTYARRYENILELMQEVVNKAKEALAKTPEQLPILKQVGVVDAGGQGLVYIYEGFVRALSGQESDLFNPTQDNGGYTISPSVKNKPTPEKPKSGSPHKAQAKLSTEDIENPYDMEFFIRLNSGNMFNENLLRQSLERLGDSVIVIQDDAIVKVHIHSNNPGDVLNLCIRYGELIQIQILNMREQHRELLSLEEETEDLPESVVRYGFVTVSSGEGISEIFTSIGADVVLSGGQTMNPSTEDILKAVNEVKAETVYILPNNSNIILAAQQAKHLVEDRQIEVIPTKTIPQGIAALLAFQEKENREYNTEAMISAIQHIRSGQVTYAVRDSRMEDLEIKEGDVLGLLENKIVTVDTDMICACQQLLSQMIQNGDEILTILTGEEAVDNQTENLISFLEKKYPDVEVEVHKGSQPLYPYIFSVE